MGQERGIPGWPDYSVTDDGVVYATGTNWRGYGKRVLIQHLNAYGYPTVRLKTSTGCRRRKTVHGLVASAFLPPRPSQAHEIRHMDGNKTNNEASNLAWGTAKDNADDRRRHGRTSRGSRHSEAIKRGFAERVQP
ncbi:HNH endonuclease [Methyloceanibacter caenitepidi]|uniref:HNH endonuclease n=1 Tax=Methyloceanibacter caenitepidi TaxID=1384459 RepID=UPI0009E51E0F